MIAGTAFRFVEDFDRLWGHIAARAHKSRASLYALLDIRDQCRTDGAVALQGPDGIVVLAVMGMEEGGFEAQCLLAVSTSSTGAFKRQEGDMLKIARALGADRLAFKTDRRGWGRLLGPEWELHEDAYVRRVP